MPTRPLSDMALHGLIISSIAAGRWKKLGIEKDGALEILVTYCRVEGPHRDNTNIVNRLIHVTQDALMAYRKDDFYMIQKEPPFSDFGKANIIKFLKAWQI